MLREDSGVIESHLTPDTGSDIQIKLVSTRRDGRWRTEVWSVANDRIPCYVIIILPENAPWDARPLLASVQTSNGQIWSFKDDSRVRAGFKGITFLFGRDGVTYVIFQSKRDLVHVVPFLDLLRPTWYEVSNKIKRDIAKALDLSPRFDYEELGDELERKEVDRINGKNGSPVRILVKVYDPRTRFAIFFEILTEKEDGSRNVQRVNSCFLTDARKVFGKVPIAPAGDGISTNVPGLGASKGSTVEDPLHRQYKRSRR